MKTGDIVTCDFGDPRVSNTFIVYATVVISPDTDDDVVILRHPLAPGLFFIKEVKELNKSLAVLKSPVERCLEFVRYHERVLNYIDIADLDALCSYFVQHRTFTNRQRGQIAVFCGKIATKLLNSSLERAAEIVMVNQALLDEFAIGQFNLYRSVLKNPAQVKTHNERYAICGLAGFVLAQLHEGSNG